MLNETDSEDVESLVRLWAIAGVDVVATLGLLETWFVKVELMLVGIAVV